MSSIRPAPRSPTPPSPPTTPRPQTEEGRADPDEITLIPPPPPPPPPERGPDGSKIGRKKKEDQEIRIGMMEIKLFCLYLFHTLSRIIKDLLK